MQEIPIPNTSRIVRLMGIDTDADVPALSVDKNLARGDFVTQLDQLEDWLQKIERADDEVGVLMLHHSFLYRYSRLRILRLPLEIRPRSRRRLQALVQKFSIRVLLSGHTHVPNVQPFQVAGQTVMEACCGTTLQQRVRPSDPENCLMVHRISQVQGGALQWTTTTYRINRAPGDKVGFKQWQSDPNLRLAASISLG
jgi:hypothetical protein